MFFKQVAVNLFDRVLSMELMFFFLQIKLVSRHADAIEHVLFSSARSPTFKVHSFKISLPPESE